MPLPTCQRKRGSYAQKIDNTPSTITIAPIALCNILLAPMTDFEFPKSSFRKSINFILVFYPFFIIVPYYLCPSAYLFISHPVFGIIPNLIFEVPDFYVH